jgi:hypothetical protein
MPFDPEPAVFVRDTIADVEALNVDNDTHQQIWSENAFRVLGLCGP